MIPIIYLDDNKTSYELLIKLQQNHITYSEKDIKSQSFEELKPLVMEIRSIRPKLMKTLKQGTDIEWKFYKLAKGPILKTEKETLPAWYIEKNMDLLIHELKANQKQPKKKLKIRRIIRNQNSQSICLTANALGRINTTILRALHGINVVNLVNSWSLEERTAFVIAWRLCQHQKRNELRIFADMLENKAKTSDPYAEKNNEWIGSI